ncbi:hypothetical protein [Leifsonia shinshuensis]|uniref:hypothetical protein n=1 Tax=Leifsonia shinshuensis TaxID=150026 RepID=UPI001F50F36E|nr:hypothetical protein [Leifsonia shinshuensis]
MESKLRPKVVLWWGIGLTLAGVLVTLLLPQLAYTAAMQPSAATRVDQALLTVLDLVIRVVGQVLSPLGVALIGASVVMAYVALPAARRTAEAEPPTFD